jgi:hypothetical protein
LPDGSVATTYDARVREAREGRPVVLWVLVAVLALGCVVGGIQVAHARGSRDRSATQQERYAAAMSAADDVATAFVNVRHDTAARDLRRIGDLSTGPLKARYVDDVGRLVRAVRQQHTVTVGEVVWAGVVHVDSTGATVLVATHGTRSDRQTEGEEVARDLRLTIELVPVDDHWLATEIGQVS